MKNILLAIAFSIVVTGCSSTRNQPIDFGLGEDFPPEKTEEVVSKPKENLEVGVSGEVAFHSGLFENSQFVTISPKVDVKYNKEHFYIDAHFMPLPTEMSTDSLLATFRTQSLLCGWQFGGEDNAFRLFVAAGGKYVALKRVLSTGLMAMAEYPMASVSFGGNVVFEGGLGFYFSFNGSYTMVPSLEINGFPDRPYYFGGFELGIDYHF